MDQGVRLHEVTGSTAVRRIGYSGRARELHVQFVSGDEVYIYANVPLQIVGAVFKSHSKGRALHRHVLGKKEYRRTAGGEVA